MGVDLKQIIYERTKRRNEVKNDIYGEPEIITYKNIVAKVRSPILTEEERKRRMERIKQAAVRLVLSKEVSNDE